ncbi:hypothetical protein CRYUN_Cryun06bG0069600 [Craigia yunnanensis]
MTIGGFPCFVEEMKVFERQILNGHYGVTAFVFGNTFSALPFLALVALISGAITYFLPGLHKGYENFLFFVLALFACMMLVESLMMIVASLVPNFLMGIIVDAGIQGLMMLVGGFFRLPADLPKPVLKYPLYHIAFNKYAYRDCLRMRLKTTEKVKPVIAKFKSATSKERVQVTANPSAKPVYEENMQ